MNPILAQALYSHVVARGGYAAQAQLLVLECARLGIFAPEPRSAMI